MELSVLDRGVSLVYTLYIHRAGFAVETRIKKWGNSLGIRIPQALAEGLGLHEDTIVDIESDGTQILIRPRITYKLDELLSLVTSENMHPETEWGKPRGKEIL